MSFDGDTVRYIVARRVGDFHEYLQDDGNFGPLADHQARDLFRTRNDMTRVFFERSYAEAFVKAWERKHPTVAHFTTLEIWRLP
jgi:hypothetical protein